MISEANVVYEMQQMSGIKSKRSLGWFRIDIEKYPELAMSKVGQNQIVTTDGNTKLLNIKKIGDPLSQVDDFVDAVNLLTGDWVTHLSNCDDLFDEDGNYPVSLIYFGSEMSLQEG